MGEADGQQLLESTLSGDSDDLRLRAAALLCQRGSQKSLALLSQAAAHSRVPPPLLFHFLYCLTQAGDVAARQQLRSQLQRGPADSALFAAAKLAQLGYEDGRAYLRERLRQPGSAGFGIAGLAIDNQCVAAAVLPAIYCRDRFDTARLGAGLLVPGLILSGVGSVLVALPGSRGEASRSPSRADLQPGGVGLAISF